jgi:hypothetical protein
MNRARIDNNPCSVTESAEEAVARDRAGYLAKPQNPDEYLVFIQAAVWPEDSIDEEQAPGTIDKHALSCDD